MTERIPELEYLKMTALQKFGYNFVWFFNNIPNKFKRFFTAVIPALFLRLWYTLKGWFSVISNAAKYGDWKTRTSFVVMGFSHLARKQIMRGLIYFVFEVLFVLYMVFFGAGQLAMFGTLGTHERGSYIDPVTGIEKYTAGDNSLLILIYSILTLFIIVSFVYLWYYNLKTGYAAQEIEEARKKLPTARDDISSLADEQYHKTLLSVPLLGLTIFTIFPIIFMIFVAFTNYDVNHNPPTTLFTWIGWDNFAKLFGGGAVGAANNFGKVFLDILIWTVIWAFFATFSNYILGMIVALIINKKGIRLKKLWRTILILTIAVPQFISLLLMSQMLSDTGFVNTMLQEWGITSGPIPFLSDGTVAKVTIIVVNMWVGIPYTMLMCTGILMNIPEDLYESAKIDGAGPVKAYMKITLPYVLHVTTPYLITQFIGNLNNFNVIFLLTGGAPLLSSGAAGGAGQTDLLITWLYKMIMNEKLYGVASVISIMMFIITAAISLVVYNRSKAVKNEEDFM